MDRLPPITFFSWFYFFTLVVVWRFLCGGKNGTEGKLEERVR
jgi:hypothetical protein